MVSRFRDNNLRLITHKAWVWIVQFVGYIGIAITVFVMPAKSGIIRSIIYVDLIMFVMQLAVYWFHYKKE